ncbi:hypothetical protein [Spongiactinospora sp. TRM90649]|uniref:hypothetical protein n=1 Tax=Spongiactinospora sp. TRM90649 TaxID=3031114 RepID=UPI0023F82A19|nr:hypothetical protein [Spongiactinospora sp. TRM90649]MDF5759277.1 hypothetical protein [Spongiactinospora sp. TRM90649]
MSVSHARSFPSLLEALEGLTDPRKRRGIRYRLVAVLAVAVVATLGDRGGEEPRDRCIGGQPLGDRAGRGARFGPGRVGEDPFREVGYSGQKMVNLAARDEADVKGSGARLVMRTML